MGTNVALLVGVAFGAVAGGLLAYLVGRIHGRDIAQRDDDAAFAALLAERDDYRDNPRAPGPMAGVIRGGQL